MSDPGHGVERVADSIWSVPAPFSLVGMHIGTRMTVVRLSNGSLLLHSPVPMSETLMAEINALGPVRHIVCPNVFHHLYAAAAVAAFPDAILHGPPALRAKRKDLAFGAELSETPHPDWGGDFELLTIAGCWIRETVFYHPATRTLIACDLVENFHGSPHAPTRLYLKLQGLYGVVGFGRLLRFLYRDRRSARVSIDRLLQWPFERLVLAHGEVLTDDARESVRRGMAWL
ncbi:DUF4336 domain-containing protein [Solimonas sp. K1W22B-7]|uniref:DUF4336 domain-containing protein n=1 Tax=Solimonas sp. K1W22B-7 TaxID=2303331 RepID=UPI000E32D5A8|nr:DUF4336 domain-containing protein [Solimonas sp. K1W22B-7]AXQ31123.1 DUF4336 domain-containing protein [Solimonas sp. K1W22B-7]